MVTWSGLTTVRQLGPGQLRGETSAAIFIFITSPGCRWPHCTGPGCNLQILLSSDEPNGQTKTRVDHRMSCLQGKLHPARSPPEEVASNSLLKLSPVSLR